MIRFAAFCLIAMLAAAPAVACSCACLKPERGAAARMIKDADYVVRGEVLSVAGPGPADINRELDIFRLRPTLALKGDPATEIEIISPAESSACGVGWEAGDIIDAIVSRNPDGRLHVNSCSQLCARVNGVFKRLDKLAQKK